jgi:hypothetical protein
MMFQMVYERGSDTVTGKDCAMEATCQDFLDRDASDASALIPMPIDRIGRRPFDRLRAS